MVKHLVSNQFPAFLGVVNIQGSRTEFENTFGLSKTPQSPVMNLPSRSQIVVRWRSRMLSAAQNNLVNQGRGWDQTERAKSSLRVSRPAFLFSQEETDNRGD